MKRRTGILAIVGLAVGLIAGPIVPAVADESTPLPTPNVYPVQVTGPTTERLNLIVLGDGYQADQQSIFREDLDRNLAVLWATEPFRTYRDYINVYAVELASIDYGVRCDPDGRVRSDDGTVRDAGEREGPIDQKNTALRMIYQNGCADPLSRGVVYGGAPVNCQDAAGYNPGVDPCETGNQARNRILDTYVAPVLGIPRTSQNIQTLAIFNSFTYGGIGGSQATTSGGSPQGPLISMHELGHSLGTLLDEYPYSSRDVVRNCYAGNEPSSFHHTIYTDEAQMIADRFKWWRWIGEESLSGGTIGLHEGGGLYPCGQRRPSEHSMMRMIGFEFDQIGLEHMVARVTGMRNSGQMSVQNSALGTVPNDGVLWVESGHPRYHQMQITWRLGGPEGEVIQQGPSSDLDLEPLGLPEGTVVWAEVRDPVGPDGIDWVRNPSTGNSATDSGYNGSRFVQTRQWTLGADSAAPTPAVAQITQATQTTQPIAGDEVVYVETNHPSDRMLDVAWELDGAALDHEGRTLDLGELGLTAGTHELTATVSDPADPSVADEIEWVVDNALPTAPRTLSEPLAASLVDGHPIYFDGWDMKLDPQDDQTGYPEERYVVGQLRLDNDGWFNYFGFPEKPMPESPFEFRSSGTVAKALVYGNLGTGGLSRAAFELNLPDEHPAGGFIPGFGTHVVEHRAIDPAGNIGEAESYTATALPGAQLECTETLTGKLNKLTVSSGVTCIEDASVNGGVTVTAGASLLVTDSSINGGLSAVGAKAIQLVGVTLNGSGRIANTTDDLTVVGSRFSGAVSITGTTQATASERFSRLAGAYGPVFAGNLVDGKLDCSGNSAPLADFGAGNSVNGAKTGDCSAL
ncbi:M64 family metallopeptidase [Agromyces sp. NPDC055520]